MFHKIKLVTPLKDFEVSVQFAQGITKIYDIKTLFSKIKAFKKFKETPSLFYDVTVDVGGYGIIWNDDLDLSCDELFKNGKTVKTPFDGLIAFTDATKLWGLNESTLRKAISQGITEIDEERNKELVTEEMRLTHLVTKLFLEHTDNKLDLSNIKQKENVIFNANDVVNI